MMGGAYLLVRLRERILSVCGRHYEVVWWDCEKRNRQGVSLKIEAGVEVEE